MNKRLIVIALTLLCLCPQLWGQTSKAEIYSEPAKSGGVYYAYPVPTQAGTKVPDGYTPFYISMYGRHGSRYLLGDGDYTTLIGLLNKAKAQQALTALGCDVLNRLLRVWPEAVDRDGDLSPLGVRQYRGIAERMYRSCPGVFTDSTCISARSTLSVRSVLSMDAFCERLKEFNPKLNILRDATKRDASYMSFHTTASDAFNSEQSEWQKDLKVFEKKMLHPDRLVKSLFSNAAFIQQNVKPLSLMWNFYWVASDMQNMETPVSFYDIFEGDELFNLWQCFNYRFYAQCGNFKRGMGVNLENAKPLLKDMLQRANTAIATGKSGASFYFGHDMDLMRLMALMQVEGCDGSTYDENIFYRVWSDFKIAPMAANFQMIFYKNAKNEVLVKFMLNEREKTLPVSTNRQPYYDWKTVSVFLSRLSEMKN